MNGIRREHSDEFKRMLCHTCNRQTLHHYNRQDGAWDCLTCQRLRKDQDDQR